MKNFIFSLQFLFKQNKALKQVNKVIQKAGDKLGNVPIYLLLFLYLKSINFLYLR